MYLRALFKLEAYRITNKRNTAPIITITHAPTIPPTVPVKLSDDEICITSRTRDQWDTLIT